MDYILLDSATGRYARNIEQLKKAASAMQQKEWFIISHNGDWGVMEAEVIVLLNPPILIRYYHHLKCCLGLASMRKVGLALMSILAMPRMVDPKYESKQLSWLRTDRKTMWRLQEFRSWKKALAWILDHT